MAARKFIDVLSLGLALLAAAAAGAETVEDVVQDALLLIEQDQPAGAVPVLRRAVELDPDNAVVRHSLGYALWRIGQVDAAAVELERALDLSPGNPDTRYILGRIVATRASALIESQKPGQAVPLLQRAADLAPGEAGIHHYLGYALWSSGSPDEAALAFERALELAPENAYTMYFLGRIAASRGQTERATELYEAVVDSGSPVYDTHQQRRPTSERERLRRPWRPRSWLFGKSRVTERCTTSWDGFSSN